MDINRGHSCVVVICALRFKTRSVVEHERRKPVERAVVERVHNRKREGCSRQTLISWLGPDAAWRQDDAEAAVGRPNDRADGWHEMVAVRQKLQSEVRPRARKTGTTVVGAQKLQRRNSPRRKQLGG